MTTATTSFKPFSTTGSDVLPDMSTGTANYISDYVKTLHTLLDAVDPKALEQVVSVLFDAYQQGRRLVLCGNGGSAATASHLVCDFQKNIFLEAGKSFEVIALTDSPSLLSAWGNDTEFANIFAGQARTWLRPGDVLIGISGSGNSANVLRAVEVAKEVGATSIGWSGYRGGKLAEMVDLSIVVPQANMQQIEDLHMIFGHIVFSALRDRVRGVLGE